MTGDKNLAFFGVYDGHGGKEVAIFTKDHLTDCVRMSEHFKSKRYDEALREGYLKIDEELTKDWGREELANMKKKNPPSKSPLFKILSELSNNGNNSGE